MSAGAGARRRPFVLWGLAAAAVAAAAWILATGGGDLELGDMRVSVRSAQRPLVAALVLAAAALWREPELGPRARAGARSVALRLRSLSALRQLALALCGLAVLANASTWLEAVDTTNDLRERARTLAQTRLFDNGSQPHLEELVRRVVTRASAAPAVVHVGSHDRRAQLAAFYCYPRLLLMEPSVRRWARRDRMQSAAFGADPRAQPHGPPPQAESSRRFAAERAAELIEIEARAWE